MAFESYGLDDYKKYQSLLESIDYVLQCYKYKILMVRETNSDFLTILNSLNGLENRNQNGRWTDGEW